MKCIYVSGKYMDFTTANTPHCTPMKRGKVSSNLSTHEAAKFGDSICLVCVSTFNCLFNRAQPTRALTNIGGGCHLAILNFRSDHSPSFASSILPFPLIVPHSPQLCQPFNHLAKQHRTSFDRNGPIASGFQPLDFYS
jgi:hypothetical protein